MICRPDEAVESRELLDNLKKKINNVSSMAREYYCLKTSRLPEMPLILFSGFVKRGARYLMAMILAVQGTDDAVRAKWRCVQT